MSCTDSGYVRGDPVPQAEPSQVNARDVSQPPTSPRSVPPAVICDFDDTIAVENVAELLLEHFSEDGIWRQLKRRSREKLLPFKEYQEQAFILTKASMEAMQAVVKEQATLRPHFRELWRYCRERDIPMAIVTVGLDFYVDALLEREGLKEVPRYAAKARFTPQGMTFEYPYPWDGSGTLPQDICLQWGNCKCSVLAKYKRKGHSILYVGDGRSDFCPASMADHIFARSQLAELCRQNGVLYTEFQDFQDVLNGLKSRVDQSFNPAQDKRERGEAG